MKIRINIIVFMTLSGLMTGLPRLSHAAFEGLSLQSNEFILLLQLVQNDSVKFSAGLSREYRFDLPELSVNRFHFTANLLKIFVNAYVATSGDKLYDESIYRLSAGMKSAKLMAMITGDLYVVNIAGYGGKSAAGAGFVAGLKVTDTILLATGGNGLLRGGLRTGHDDISRNIWAAVCYDIGEVSSLKFVIENEQFSRPESLTISANHQFTEFFNAGIRMTDNPSLYGIMLEMTVMSIQLKTAIDNHPALGLIKMIGLEYKW